MKKNEILEAFGKVAELYESWGIQYKDYVFCGAHSLRLQDYEVYEEGRERRIDTLIIKGKLPWKPGHEFTSVTPPPNSKYFEDFIRFMKENSYSMDFHLQTEEIIKNNIDYTLPNGKLVRLLTPLGEVKGHEWLFSSGFAESTGKETAKRWIKYILDIKEEAQKHGDKEIVERCEKFLQEYSKSSEPD